METKCPNDKSKEAELKRQGWTRRFVADEPRLSEAVELYKSLGYEVRLEPAAFDEAPEMCRKCLMCRDSDKYKVIYTRPEKREEGDTTP
ncbi:MAG: hypothetical protein RMJ15_06685 [Nitrososphaerota archaeon]|nr:hypothetical protein [Candidatus Bathyarchaeota archaeon]MDW8023405.1 hypothetical protein [Nitrososphaerota archaeon]